MTTQRNETIVTTREQIIRTFKKWNENYLNAPEEFIENKYDEEGAEASASYFIDLLHKA